MIKSRGISLIELLLAVVIITVVILTMVNTFPNALKVLRQNRVRHQGMIMASNAMQEIKSKPYALIQNTPDADFSDTSVTGCDCSASAGQIDINTLPLNSANYPYNVTKTQDDLTAEIRVCINRVEKTGGSWQSHCSASTADDDLKNIRVSVKWMDRGTPVTIEQESLIAR